MVVGMGLLDSFFGTPEQTQALGLLGVGMMGRGGFREGAGLAMGHLAGAEDRKMKRSLLDMQMQNYQSEIEQRRAAMEKAKRDEEFFQSIFGPQGAPSAQMGQLGSGSFGVMPTAPGVPSIPQSGGQRVPNLSFDQLAMLKRRGLDLTELHKYANDPRKLESGSTYEDRVTGQQRYFPRLPEGMGPQAGGRYGFVPGYADSVADLERRKAGATAGVQADHDLVQVAAPDGSMRFVPRSHVLRPPSAAPAGPTSMRANPADADRFAILTQELAKAEAAGNVQDAQAVRNEISRLSPAARTTPSPSGLAVAGGFQATPTTEQAAAAAEAKARAEASGRASAARDDTSAKKAISARDTMDNIWQARTLLETGATGSLLGAGVDKVMGWAGKRDQSGLNADRLETISGWLVSNVPRMEGPQSNYDVENYKLMAGRVGDRSFPVEGRLAALTEVERIQSKYAHLNGAQPQPTKPPAGKAFETLPPANLYRGKTATDQTTGEKYVSNGMSWVKKEGK